MMKAAHPSSFCLLSSITVALALSSLPVLAQGPKKHALVIGNHQYQHANRLPNATNDSADVASALTSAGWTVTTGKNLGIKQMIRTLRTFCEKATGCEAAIFYYAGHGVEVKKQNYLLPVDAELSESDGEDALPLETLSLKKVLDDLGGADIRLKTVVLDCCRDNPLSRSWMRTRSDGGGLAAVPQKALPKGTILVFSTAPGQIALDGAGRNSPFTSAFLKRVNKGGGSIFDIFGDVARILGDQQPAWIRFDGSGVSLSAFRDYPLIPGGEPAPPPRGHPLLAATKDSPWVNHLGMEFIPLPGKPGHYMCRTETRVRDFRAYAKSENYEQKGGAHIMKVVEKPEGGLTTKRELDADAGWEKPGFPQTENDPVVCVSWDEARAFCDWLSNSDSRLTYRLPTDEEWSAAVGSLHKYPWGNEFPPPKGSGNYFGKEAPADWPGANWKTAYDHDDGFARTAPVGRFQANRFGFHDLGGNVWEWCQDWYRDEMNDKETLDYLKTLGFDDGGGQKYRVLRGGSWGGNSEVFLRSSYRDLGHPTLRSDDYGFRCVVSPAR